MTGMRHLSRCTSPRGRLWGCCSARGSGKTWVTLPRFACCLSSAGGALASRFDDPAQLALFGAWFAALTLLLAIDLDQRLLPDIITLPLIVLALVAALSGVAPLVRDAFGIPGAAAPLRARLRPHAGLCGTGMEVL